MTKAFLLLPLLFFGCAERFAAFQKSEPSRDVVFEELRTDIADVKHALHTKDVELRLLEERMEAEGLFTSELLKQQIAALQRKVDSLERSLEKASADLHALASHASQTTASLSQYRDRIAEIDKKMDEAPKPRSSPSVMIHSVKSGDTLQKIANRYNVSLDALKKENNLGSDKIVSGQKLKIPSGNG